MGKTGLHQAPAKEFETWSLSSHILRDKREEKDWQKKIFQAKGKSRVSVAVRKLEWSGDRARVRARTRVCRKGCVLQSTNQNKDFGGLA